MHTLGALTTAAKGMRLAGPNLKTGFHAASVDLARLQTALARGILRFDVELLEARWSEVFDWMLAALRAWVQRAKRVRIERRENGVHIELETQDDHGYYSYAFDVFPGRPARGRK
jgi:hypothetical protein